jgi:hypothetical protein
VPIIELQRRLREIGRIRMGEQVPTGNGKTRPTKLDNFRLTAKDQRVIDAAAALWGGTVEPWQAPDGPQWQVKITATELAVVVPPHDMAFSQWYEQWSAGGCQVRCDGATDYVGEKPCHCDPEARECKMTTRLSLMLPELPGMGLWRAESHGYYAAVELAGLVDIAATWTAAGRMIPARLRLEQRTVKRKGKTHRFAVPVLDLDVHPLVLTAGPDAAGQLAAPSAGALTVGNLTPVPALKAGAAPSVADQLARADETPNGNGRRNAAQSIPATGIEPRTVTEVSESVPDGEPQRGRNQGHEGDGPPASAEPDGPAPTPAPTTADIGRQSQDVFAADYQAAPRGHKTKVVDRLRHAVANVVTKGRATTVTECTPEERVRVAAMLKDITNGRVTYTHDALDDQAGATFTLLRPEHPEGDKEVTVLWSVLEAPVEQEANGG